MKIHNFLISGLLLLGCSFTNVQAAELSGKCPAGPALVKSEPKRLGDNLYHAEHYCIMDKRPAEGQIRGLQKTEIGEVEEPFAKGQKGSSAMPHKRNPIGCDRTHNRFNEAAFC